MVVSEMHLDTSAQIVLFTKHHYFCYLEHKLQLIKGKLRNKHEQLLSH